MAEYMKTGIGGEVTDQVVRNAGPSKPVWHLVPLPLSQLQETRRHRGPIQSLHSYCLASISKNLHLFSPDSFQGVAPLLIRRLLGRIKADREYDFDSPTTNPDEATIWALSALLDPEKADPLILALPMLLVMDHLAPNPLIAHVEHPIVELPRLYASLQPTSIFLTTLTLNGMDRLINDQNIISLKYCTHLNALWMRGCYVTDAGIRLLASSLELPGDQDPDTGRGMWRLRAWFLPGCKEISDRSMKSFARWPGLSTLDVRNTSCTSSSIDIFNRFSQALFAGYNADLQPCTEGLIQLFSSSASPAETLDNLNLTLTKPRSDVKPIALHIIPSSQPVPSFYLPDPPSSSHDDCGIAASSSRTSVFRSGGIGQIYGSGVSRITDEVAQQRNRLNTALQMTYDKEWMDSATPAQKRKKTMAENKAKRERWSFGQTNTFRHQVGKVYKEKKGGGGADARSKKFVKGDLKANAALAADVDDLDRLGDRSAMLVRMVNSDWDRLQWALPGSGLSTASASIRVSGASSYNFSAGSSQKTRPADLVSDILGAAKLRTPAHSQSSPISASSPSFSQTPTRATIDPASSPSSTPRSLSQNPFRSASTTTINGVTPLNSRKPQLSDPSISIRPIISAKPIVTQARPTSDVKPFFSAQSNSTSSADLDFSFSSTRKRTFDGSGNTEAKRRGMKMFSLGSGK